MAHKITLTGVPSSGLRKYGESYSFDMEESGSPAAPKGLPTSNTVTYTVFVNKKQLTKAGLDKGNFQEHKIMVQGEPTLDVPVDDCPGEIGVVCFQVSIIPSKEKVPDNKPQTSEPPPQRLEKEIQEAVTHVAAAAEVEIDVVTPPPSPPQLQFDELIPLAHISVPEHYLRTPPNRKKTEKVIDYVKQNGQLDEPIIVKKETLVLLDGYRRYVVATELNMELVPVVYQ